jgi:hypothetical protein
MTGRTGEDEGMAVGVFVPGLFRQIGTGIAVNQINDDPPGPGHSASGNVDPVQPCQCPEIAGQRHAKANIGDHDLAGILWTSGQHMPRLHGMERHCKMRPQRKPGLFPQQPATVGT